MSTRARVIVTGFVALVGFAGYLGRQHVAEPRAAATIESFYRAYLQSGPPQEDKGARLTFSKAFDQMLQENKQLCAEKAGTDICGWGADGDVFLDAQEYDGNLTPEEAGLSVEEVAPGSVRVKLNVYPSVKDAGDAYLRDITFQMIREGDAWVVDDINYSDGRTARKTVAKENAYWQKPN